MVLRSRRSYGLSPDEVTRLRAAGGKAFCLGLPLNWAISIHCGKVGSTNAQRVVSAYLKRYGDWLRKVTGLPSAWLWVIENPEAEFGQGGLHVHVLLHVPEHLAAAFRKLRKGWLGLQGVPKGALHADRLYYSEPGRWHTRSYLEHGLLGKLGYLSKGIVPHHAASLGLERVVPQGEVRGKRIGISEALSPWRKSPPLPTSHPRAWIAPAESRRRRWLAYNFPELLGISSEQANAAQLGAVPDLGASD